MKARPHVIRNDEDNKRCVDLLDPLINKNATSSEEEELIGVLSLLIGDYEKRFVIEPGASQAEII